jgi:formiminotetrahydrofolate cyclodeaminase
MYRDGSIRKYLDDAAAGSAAPGGGSVSAFAGALATTMGSMAAHFTVGRKKFLDVEPLVKGVLSRLERERETLLELMDRDVEAYGAVSAAYARPRGTAEEKAARTAKIQEALVVAMDVPLRTMRACLDVLRDLSQLVDVANPNLISDVGVSAILAEAALRAAKLNVEVNLASLMDEALARRTGEEVHRAAEEAARTLRDVLAKVSAKMTS